MAETLEQRVSTLEADLKAALKEIAALKAKQQADSDQNAYLNTGMLVRVDATTGEVRQLRVEQQRGFDTLAAGQKEQNAALEVAKAENVELHKRASDILITHKAGLDTLTSNQNEMAVNQAEMAENQKTLAQSVAAMAKTQQSMAVTQQAIFEMLSGKTKRND